jgi:hypothetical protein
MKQEKVKMKSVFQKSKTAISNFPNNLWVVLVLSWMPTEET